MKSYVFEIFDSIRRKGRREKMYKGTHRTSPQSLEARLPVFSQAGISNDFS